MNIITPRGSLIDVIETTNGALADSTRQDFDALGEALERDGVDINSLLEAASDFGVAIPSWGCGTGGTRFARFPIAGEPRNVFEKIEDCAVVNALSGATPTVSPHFPWDQVDDMSELRAHADHHGLAFDAVNSNTFQDPKDADVSFKFGSLSHTDRAVRDVAIEHNLKCIENGKTLGSKALTVWIADGSNFPGQQNHRAALGRYLDSMQQIYASLPDDWRVFIEHKLFEPAFYSTVICDWGTSYHCARELGPKAYCLVDLGHHAPTTNIEVIVSRLIQFGKLGGFHFNDSKYGDDDLDSGSIDPFRLFLVFNELVDADAEGAMPTPPAHMLDQSHNVSDPIESLMLSAAEVQRAFIQALLVDRDALRSFQIDNDVIRARELLKKAFRTNVDPILATARERKGAAIDPVAAYRDSGYRQSKVADRPVSGSSAGIV